MIDYYKENEFIINKIIEISDSFIMLQIIALYCDYGIRANLSFESIYYFKEKYSSGSLIIEPYQYGKNIDLKYQEIF